MKKRSSKSKDFDSDMMLNKNKPANRRRVKNKSFDMSSVNNVNQVNTISAPKDKGSLLDIKKAYSSSQKKRGMQGGRIKNNRNMAA